MPGRRLIGVDLAWGERAGSGCVELRERPDGLELVRLDVLQRIDEIVEWIAPERGAWVVAVDAPLVVHNKTGRRVADAEVSARYRAFEAGALPTNRTILGDDHRGGRLWRALAASGATLFEDLAKRDAPRLVLECFPHVAMVELFGLERIIKYKRGSVAERRAGQGELAAAIGRWLCQGSRGEAEPPSVPSGQLPQRGSDWDGQAAGLLRRNGLLNQLLREPVEALRGRALKQREDLLDGLVCAYVAAWVDAGGRLQALGEVGAGVVIGPHVRGIAG